MVEAPGADSVGVDADEGGWTGDGFGAAGDFYGPRIEPGTWRDAVDDYRGFPRMCDITELLCGVHRVQPTYVRSSFIGLVGGVGLSG